MPSDAEPAAENREEVKIPVENIYYLLCYAWDKLDQQEQAEVDTECAATPLDLLGRMLIRASKTLLKRGIDHNYRECAGEVNGIKGKLLLTRTIKENQLFHQRTSCIYDEFSPDILSNRIWITTLRLLLDIRELDTGLKHEIVKLIRMLPPVTPLRVTPAHFDQVLLHRNNHLYGFVLNICRLIHENSLPTEQEGTFRFVDFTRDERKMSLLFENFVRNFYRLEQQKYAVSREQLKWQFVAVESSHQRYLPKMITDISLENEEHKIIIDTKYYTQTLSSYYDVEKIHATNLYQLFSYLMNARDGSEKAGRAAGILLYPTIDQEYDLTYYYEEHPISIKTVNLNAHWSRIADRLKQIIGV